MGGRLLVDALDRLEAGTVQPTPQDEGRATYAPKLTPADRKLDWTKDAPAVVRRVRAFAPEPGASTAFRGRSLKVLSASARDESGEPGTVIQTGKEGFVVAAGEGGVAPLELAPAGRKHMSAAEFLRGYRPEIGERFG